MSPAKRFILTVAIISLGMWLLGNFLWGPPDYSAEYLAAHKHDHDRYLIATKSVAYKRYLQRPHLNAPGSPNVPDDFAAQLAFIEAYENRPEFQAERARRHKHYMYFEIFNALLLVGVGVYFARKPLLNFLDAGIAELRESMTASVEARKNAEAQLAEAKQKLRRFDQVKQEIASDTLARIQYELDELSRLHHVNKEHFGQEMVDRKALAERRAMRRVKMELVQLSIKQLEEQAKGADAEQHARWLDAFSLELEKRA